MICIQSAIAPTNQSYETHSFKVLQYVSHGIDPFSTELFPSGHHSGEPQSSRIRTSSTCNKYDNGDVSVRCPPPDNGVNVIIAVRVVRVLSFV